MSWAMYSLSLISCYVTCTFWKMSKPSAKCWWILLRLVIWWWKHGKISWILEQESMLSDYVDCFQYAFSSWPLFYEYVNHTWIIPYKSYFIKVWTNKIMHLSNKTTNRYDLMLFYLVIYIIYFMILFISFLSRLGLLIGAWRKHWGAVWETFVHVGMLFIMSSSFNIIRWTCPLKKSFNVMSKAFKEIRYRRLFGHVSKYTLGLIVEEFDQVKYIGLDSGSCECVLRRT